VSEAHGCEQLAQGCYLTAWLPGIELATTKSPEKTFYFPVQQDLPNGSLQCFGWRDQSLKGLRNMPNPEAMQHKREEE